MPRVKLGTPTPAQQRAVMNKIIKKAMVDCDIEDYTALGLQSSSFIQFFLLLFSAALSVLPLYSFHKVESQAFFKFFL